MLRVWGSLPLELASLADMLEREEQNSGAPSGHRHYNHSDYTIHRRAGWFASIKMFSSRTKSGERTNNENLQGSRQSDGRLYLVLDGDEYFGRDVWPAFDWSRLPGITVEQKAGAANDAYGYGSRSFAGGTGDGRNGVSGMELAPLNSSLIAKKAWFFFDDAIVFLANSIASTTQNRVETIVNQWPVLDPASKMVAEGQWRWFERVGYYFPSGQTSQSARGTRSGSWAALGGSSDSSPRTADLLTLWIDHGSMPSNEAAAYVIVPNIAADSMRTWVASTPISILANDGIVSAARDNRTNALGIVFWRPSVFGRFGSDAPAIVYVVDDGHTVRVSASDPTQGAGTLRITIPGSFASADSEAIIGPQTATLILPRMGGRTTTVTLTRATPRRRAAR